MKHNLLVLEKKTELMRRGDNVSDHLKAHRKSVCTFIYVFLINTLFLEQFYVYIKIEQKVQRISIIPFLPLSHSFSFILCVVQFYGFLEMHNVVCPLSQCDIE